MASEREVVGVRREPELAGIVEVDVVEHEHALGVDGRLSGRPHQQGAVEPELHLLVRVDVRVVPEQPGVACGECVRKRLVGIDRAGEHGITVHLGGQPQAMPVNRGRAVGDSVGEANDQGVADIGEDQRARDRRHGLRTPGVAIGRHFGADAIAAVIDPGCDGFKVNLDDARVGIQIDRGRKRGEDWAGRWGRGKRHGRRFGAAGRRRR